MALSIFIDALPYNEIEANYSDWYSDMQLSELLPNIAYSSSLHWQLYCNKYPDERGVLVDWAKEKETRKDIKIISSLLTPLDKMGSLGYLSKKVLNRIVFRKNLFANIPYKFRKDFCEKGEYLFWNEKIYRKEQIFDGYDVVSQDEGHKSFDKTIEELENAIRNGNTNIFAVFGFADSLGHKCRRGELYSRRLKPYMDRLKEVIDEYISMHPDEEVLIMSDHGMSTVKEKVDLQLEKHFGKQDYKSYIAYSDSAIMCVWLYDKNVTDKLVRYLEAHSEGHLLTEEEREFYGATDRKFGDLIYILREGYVFANNWFGKSIRKPGPDGSGMHGFWPERTAKDSLACIMLINGKRHIEKYSDYRYANELVSEIMKGEA